MKKQYVFYRNILRFNMHGVPGFKYDIFGYDRGVFYGIAERIHGNNGYIPYDFSFKIAIGQLCQFWPFFFRWSDNSRFKNKSIHKPGELVLFGISFNVFIHVGRIGFSGSLLGSGWLTDTENYIKY
jgi:hypothetical protein